MDIDNGRAGNLRLSETTDPRTRLCQEKFFSQRPKPLERWLWRQRVPPAAERVFWFHWTEGARNGDWCSQFALHFIARQCEIDASTVTRSYQCLKRLGLIRRADPGRDAANPFEQATCITEVLIPSEVLAELQASPNRPAARPRASLPAQSSPAPTQAPARPKGPHEHRTFRERRARLKELATFLSPSELDRWNKAICGTAQRLEFDADTQVTETIQAEIQQYLASRGAPTSQIPTTPAADATKPARPRQLSVFDIARLRRGIQKLGPLEGSDELTRQVLWSIEAGSLRQFGLMHAINIALKKIRSGQWSRPHRMPPNWRRKVPASAQPETCGGA